MDREKQVGKSPNSTILLHYNIIKWITFKVNEQFAIDLLSEEPVVCVKGTHVYCDGGRGALGHPKVYINLDKPEINDCGYCGKRFLAEKYKEQFPKENYVDQS